MRQSQRRCRASVCGDKSWSFSSMNFSPWLGVQLRKTLLSDEMKRKVRLATSWILEAILPKSERPPTLWIQIDASWWPRSCSLTRDSRTRRPTIASTLSRLANRSRPDKSDAGPARREAATPSTRRREWRAGKSPSMSRRCRSVSPVDRRNLRISRYNRVDTGRMLRYNRRCNQNIELGAINVEVRISEVGRRYRRGDS